MRMAAWRSFHSRSSAVVCRAGLELQVEAFRGDWGCLGLSSAPLEFPSRVPKMSRERLQAKAKASPKARSMETKTERQALQHCSVHL